VLGLSPYNAHYSLYVPAVVIPVEVSAVTDELQNALHLD